MKICAENGENLKISQIKNHTDTETGKRIRQGDKQLDLQRETVGSKLIFLLATNLKHRKLIQWRISILYSMK